MQLDNTGALPAIDGSALTGISAMAISTKTPMSGDGTPGDPLGVDPSSVTLQGNAFNGNSQLVQLTPAGIMPALDISNTTNYVVVGSSISAATISIASLDFIFVATTTVNTRGGRFLLGHAVLAISNMAAGGSKLYTCQTYRNGVPIGLERDFNIPGGDIQVITMPIFDFDTLAGNTDYAIAFHSDSTNTPQDATEMVIVGAEF